MNEILFTDTVGIISDYFPTPAKKNIPFWYRDTKSYVGEKKVTEKGPTFTIKKCAPLFDILTAGYIIPTWSDLWVEQKDGQTFFHSGSKTMVVDAHPAVQIELHPDKKSNENAFKFINPWSIKTPKGYSCFFLPPSHNPNPFFESLSAIVDTDNYYAPVNFPFFLKDSNFEGLIPAGTPLIQVIPFKRQTWKMQFGTREDEVNSFKKVAELHTSLFNAYRNRFWSRKEFN